MPFWAMATGSVLLPLAVHHHVQLLAQGLQLVDSGRAVHVAGHQQGLLAFLAQVRRSLPLKVVLPEPCKPLISTTVGFPAQVDACGLATHQLGQLIVVILVSSCPGLTLVSTFWPKALAFTRSVKSLAVLKFTSASSRAADLLHGLGHVDLRDLALALEDFEGSFELVFSHSFRANWVARPNFRNSGNRHLPAR
jgi:hypothetical protein